MNFNLIEAEIRKNGGDPLTSFVFPSSIAAALWMEKALDITGTATLPADRFIAWDRFKEEAVQATLPGRRPVSSVIRKLYARDLAARNTSAKQPFFAVLVPPAYAGESSIFAGWIAGLLPQLGLWEHKILHKQHVRNPEDNDLVFLKKDYSSFLEEHRLFEPSWQRPPLRDTGRKYCIFFPEAMEDFSEYKDLLAGSKNIRLIHVPGKSEENIPGLTVYETSRDEITAAALEIESLLAEGCLAEDIAVSVPDAETLSPYILREFSLRGIPVQFRLGSPLGKHPAGRMFSLIRNCISGNFSFKAMKSLLLDRLIPWKEQDIADELIRFGIYNHCVSSWKENGKFTDVWEEAFRTPVRDNGNIYQLQTWYRKFRRTLESLAGSGTFSQLRSRYFSFREQFLDRSLLQPEDDAVIARCIEELNALIACEESIRGITPEQPYAFFIKILGETLYVPQQNKTGVNIFPYRVAAGTPYPHHFILNMNQSSATVLYRQLPFLRQDKRSEYNIKETNASEDFVYLYNSSPLHEDSQNKAGTGKGARFSASYRTFSGYATPLASFNRQAPLPLQTADPFRTERDWYSGAADIPDRLYPIQKEGFFKFLSREKKRDFSMLKTPFAGTIPGFTDFLREKQMNGQDIRVSQSDLVVFAVCNTRWLLSRIFRIETDETEAGLMNERNLGLLYHDVLKKLYDRIRKENSVFLSSEIPAYIFWTQELAKNATAAHAEFRGPLAAPLISALVKRITDGITGMLECDAEYLDNYIPDFLEEDIAFSKNGIRYYGKIDRISRHPADNTLVLIDYKSGRTPMPKDYVPGEDGLISDFQIPMYVFLAEESPESPFHGQKIEQAWFASISGREYRPIINDSSLFSHNRKQGAVSREEFEPALQSFHRETERFIEAFKINNFTRPKDLDWSVCQACDFRKICRFTYSAGKR
ncbi:PD-(D/E)XK nuclease family protein [Brucepastera parasyntrophica]|uniref:PD-(D/E)XK nuclease family protein n=1 Tax=Brucepastera parasyntrophica TaxID=2880008 RepID=UPI002109004A|nr:PD-(D/E)XK nuclease family protein [Brucepastera parasyntrophica]ULQ61068.1 PD-(D/E)XK nuclease family protein [Brucepastera parasyntrophica]